MIPVGSGLMLAPHANKKIPSGLVCLMMWSVTLCVQVEVDECALACGKIIGKQPSSIPFPLSSSPECENTHLFYWEPIVGAVVRQSNGLPWRPIWIMSGVGADVASVFNHRTC